MHPVRTVIRGAVAGAAGTTALNAVTYLDMALRGRPASQSPQQAVEVVATKAGHPVPGEGQTKEHRLGGLGPLTGIATGVGVGVVAALCQPVLARLPAPVAAAAIGLAAMGLSDGPLVALKLTEPGDWSVGDWASDLVPHLLYGITTYTTLQMADL